MIEFFVPEDGQEIFVLVNGNSEQLSTDKHKDLIDEIYYKVKDDYPKAFAALTDLYSKIGVAKFLIVRRFVKCNFSRFDITPDFDHSEFKFEHINCPLRGECKHENIICKPTLSSSLTPRELEVAQLIAENLKDEEIADKLFRSLDTIKNHRKSILRKLQLKNKTDIALWILKNYHP